MLQLHLRKIDCFRENAGRGAGFEPPDPEAELILLMGADNIASLERWHKGTEILREFAVWVYPRKGFDGAALCRTCAERTGARCVRFLEGAPLLDISSTQIRNQLNKNQIP